VQFTGFASDEELCRLYARCRAVFFAPKDEDYGFITLEAFRSGKGVITCVDSGGPTELVAHGESGLVVEPDEARVAAALSEVMGDEGRARALGDAGRRRTADITWDRAIGTLLS
jgi:glycosyltransferase involved in cell wall biosynthesis